MVTMFKCCGSIKHFPFLVILNFPAGLESHLNRDVASLRGMLVCFHVETVNSLRVVVFVVPNKYQVSFSSLEHKKDPAMLL